MELIVFYLVIVITYILTLSDHIKHLLLCFDYLACVRGRSRKILLPRDRRDIRLSTATTMSALPSSTTTRATTTTTFTSTIS